MRFGIWGIFKKEELYKILQVKYIKLVVITETKFKEYDVDLFVNKLERYKQKLINHVRKMDIKYPNQFLNYWLWRRKELDDY